MANTKRVGECVRCGKCCVQGWRFVYDSVTIKGTRAEWLKEIRPLHSLTKEKQPCIYLAYDAKTRQSLCENYENRPGRCRRYPAIPRERIFKSCGFRFVQE